MKITYQLIAMFGDKRVFTLLIVLVLALYFVIVNSAALRSTAIIYLLGALIVLAGLPMLRLLIRR